MADKPNQRDQAESQSDHLARYPKQSDFRTQTPFQLGLNVTYLGVGARVDDIRPGSPALGVLRMHDIILEVDGFPVGIENQRTYLMWPRYAFAQGGEVELTVAIPVPGGFAYFYPRIPLTPVTAEASA